MNAPETILILDTETTGVTDSDTAIEVACILYSLKHAAPIRSFASLIRSDSNPAEHVNRIPASLLPYAPEAAAVWTAVARHVTMADAIVAHNADFDRRFVPAMTGANVTPWVCSMDDIAWPVACESRSLVSIALAHGLGVATAHRALADCELLARLFTRAAEMGTDLGALLAHAMRPKALFRALVPFERNHEAKAAGFRWDADRRAWLRKMAVADASGQPFTFKIAEVSP